MFPGHCLKIGKFLTMNRNNIRKQSSTNSGRNDFLCGAPKKPPISAGAFVFGTAIALMGNGCMKMVINNCLLLTVPAKLGYWCNFQDLFYSMKNEGVLKPFIFLADDDPDDQAMLCNAFTQVTDEYHLIAVNSGKALADLLSQVADKELPSLIVLDYNMPGLNGIETLKLLQHSARYRTIPKIIYSSSISPANRSEMIASGASDYMAKQTSVVETVLCARKMLEYANVPVGQLA
jgi:CheY-like chemotaxis protein